MAEPPATAPQPPDTQPPFGQAAWQPGGAYDPLPPPEGRPGQVTGVAIVLIVLGVLIGLLGLLFLLMGLAFGSIVTMPEFQDQFPNVTAAAGGIIAIFGFLFLADGILQVVSGIFILPGRQWARITGLIAGVLGALFSLVGVLPGQSGGGVNLFFLLMLAGYVFVVWVLATQRTWFERRPRPPAWR
jgi:hypothetical protein